MSNANIRRSHVAQPITHANIRRSDIELALENAKLDPDGQVFPWRDMWPMHGTTVYSDGQLWTVAGIEQPMHDGSAVKLTREPNGVDPRRELVTLRYACRPVTWTQADEDRLRSDEAMRRAALALCWDTSPTIH